MTRFFLKSLDGREIPLKEWLTLGRESASFSLTGEGVEERHARLENREGAWILRDLRSQGGTYLNGARVTEAPLTDGDWIRVGREELLFFDPLTRPSAFPMESRNPEWNAILQSLDGVAASEFPVLLLGPSGTGKDVIAHKMHERSRRAPGPFISVNCSALTETLVESELFGHVKGSFTGAIGDRKGAFEAARGGTLFLDEIGDLPYGLQAKLLRALENGEIRPVGADRPVRTDVRIVAATHQDLFEKVREGAFRSDLFYRLNVLSVSPPALKDRMEDFEELLYGFCRTMRVRFSVDAIRRLQRHDWPGNIRELRNLVARASALYPRQSIEESHIERLLLGASVRPLDPLATGEASGAAAPLPVIKEIEKQMILKRLRANRGNQRRTAQDLGLPKSTLHDRIRLYGIDLESFKKA
jgi:DNA-binding NtrC family response regulator